MARSSEQVRPPGVPPTAVCNRVEGEWEWPRCPSSPSRDEGGHHVVARNLTEFLEELGANRDALVSPDEFCFAKAQRKASPHAKHFHLFLKRVLNVTPSRAPNTNVKRAQAALKGEFDAWVAGFVE